MIAICAAAPAATATEVNITGAADDLGIDRSTVVYYLEWLWTVFLIHELPPWSCSFTARAVRRSKLHVTDTGLAANLAEIGPAMLAPATAMATGPLRETFTVNQISRQLSASSNRAGMFHYRDHQKREIDLVLERRGAAVVAVEVNATRSPTTGHLRHVRWLRDKLDSAAPGTFRALHIEPQSLTIGGRLHLRPISMLWSPATTSPACT